MLWMNWHLLLGKLWAMIMTIKITRLGKRKIKEKVSKERKKTGLKIMTIGADSYF